MIQSKCKRGTSKIHPTAIVDAGAKIGSNVEIGPYCCVGPNVILEDGAILEAHVVVTGYTKVGRETRIFPFASIGYRPQDLKYKGEASELVIAYEPIWAIGTGQIPTMSQIEQMHLAIRESLRTKCTQGYESIRLLYGGSVKPDNIKEIIKIPNVDGCLVGGASLKGDTFCNISLAY